MQGTKIRFPSMTSIKSSEVASCRSVISALWIRYSPRIVLTISISSSDCATCGSKQFIITHSPGEDFILFITFSNCLDQCFLGLVNLLPVIPGSN